jgi:DNA-binding XRE family transcriptional regulator
MPEDEPDEEQTFKRFQFGGPDTEPVTVHGEDADIGDAIDAFEGLKEAQRTARLPENEDFVEALARDLRDGKEHLKRAIAISMLEGSLQAFASALGRAEENEDLELFEESALFEENEEGTFVAETDLGELMEEWKEEPPEFFSETAANFLEDTDPWDEWAEWTATHVMYWAAEDVNKELRYLGKNPETVSDEEWDRRFNDRLTVEEYFSDAVQILGAELASGVSDRIQEAVAEQELTFVDLEHLLDLHEDDEDDAPAPRPETPDYDPDPFTGPNDTALLLSGRFQNGVKDSLLEADGEPAETRMGEWGRDHEGAPVRVEKLDGGNSPYEGRAVLKVQARADADPAEVEAAMGWEILERVDMDTVWLHLLLLAHASAPHRRGERQVMTIPRKRVENVLGFHRGDGKSVKQRAEEVEQHIKDLQSIYVRFQGVRRHGDRTRLTNERNATPLWNIQMLEHADLFENSVRRDWVLKVKEGLWGEEFLHEWENPQWTPLPKEWFDQIDRRGKDWTQRLAVYLLFHFRRNVENGAVVNLNAGTMLDICGADTGGRSQRKTERKKRLSSALDALRDRYGIGVQAERVHMRHTKGMSTENWKTNSATFYPPDEMSGELFRNDSDGRPPLPEVKGGDWTKDQIKQLRDDLGWYQTDMAEFLDVDQSYVSQLESGKATPPSDRVCKLLDRLDSRRR